MFIQPLKHLLVTLPRIRSSLLDKTVAARMIVLFTDSAPLRLTLTGITQLGDGVLLEEIEGWAGDVVYRMSVSLALSTAALDFVSRTPRQRDLEKPDENAMRQTIQDRESELMPPRETMDSHE